jgi:hypothetical protein
MQPAREFTGARGEDIGIVSVGDYSRRIASGIVSPNFLRVRQISNINDT